MAEQPNPYNPWPWGFRGDVKRGAFCEVDIENNRASRFIVIRPRAYFPADRLERDLALINSGEIALEACYPEIACLGYIPDRERVFWLYNVNVCDIEKQFLQDSDSEVFAAQARNDQNYTFDNFGNCMAFLTERFGVSESDFKQDWQTNYPQY